MTRRTLSIILLTLLVISLTLFVGCGDKKAEKEASEIERLKQERVQQQQKEIEQKEVEKEVKEEMKQEEEKVYTGKKEYEIQLAARLNKDRVEISKENLNRYGYNAKITTTYKDGKKFYRLRMQGLYSKAEAEDLGEKLIKQFPEVKNYWIQKVK